MNPHIRFEFKVAFTSMQTGCLSESLFIHVKLALNNMLSILLLCEKASPVLILHRFQGLSLFTSTLDTGLQGITPFYIGLH